MKKCKLGHECADNAKTCPECGHQFTSMTAVLVIALAILIGLAGLLLSI